MSPPSVVPGNALSDSSSPVNHKVRHNIPSCQIVTGHMQIGKISISQVIPAIHGRTE